MEILQINEEINFANGIIRKEVHSHQPYASTTFNNNDEIRIPVQQQDIFTLPHESFLYIEGKVKHESDASVTLSNNSTAFLFDEIRYELNGIEIDRSKNVGITSTIKSLLSVNDAESKFLENVAWNPHDYSNRILSSDGGYFNVCIPLKMLLGFAEDYKKIVVNARQELILVRAKNDENAFITTSGANISITIEKIQWRLPYVHVSDSERLALLKHVEMNKSIYMPFRTWELYEYPLLPPSQNQLWTVKTTTQLEKPRFVILAFQTARKNQVEKDSSLFDHCQLTNVKLYLNSECFPYENLNLNFDRDQYALLYSMYSEFQKSYYERNAQPLLSRNEFKSRAMVVIDCSNQNESIKTGSVDVRIEFESSVNFPPRTSAYCLIIHDRVVEYNPLTNYVNKIV